MIQESSDVLILGSGIVGMASLIAIDKYDIKATLLSEATALHKKEVDPRFYAITPGVKTCLLYTSPSPRDGLLSRMPSSA